MGFAEDWTSVANSYAQPQEPTAPPREPGWGEIARGAAGHSIFAPLLRQGVLGKISEAAPGFTGPLGAVTRLGAELEEFISDPRTAEGARALEARRGYEEAQGITPGFGTALKRTTAELSGSLAADLPLFFIPGGAIARNFGLGAKAALAAKSLGPTATRLAPSIAENMALFGSGGLARESVKQAMGEAPFDPIKIIKEGARESTVGAALGVAKGGGGAKALLGEFAVFGGLAPALQGRLPTREDLVGAAAMTAAFAGVHRVFGAGPGERPPEVGLPPPESVERAVSDRRVRPEDAQMLDLIERQMRTEMIPQLGLGPREADLVALVGRAYHTQKLLADPKGWGEQFGPDAVARAQREILAQQDEAALAEREMAEFNAEQYPGGKTPTGFGTEVRIAPGEAPRPMMVRGKLERAAEVAHRGDLTLPGGERVQGGFRRVPAGPRRVPVEEEIGTGEYLAVREPEIAGRTKAEPTRQQVETSSLLKKAQRTITQEAEPEVQSEHSKTLRAAEQTLSSARLEPKPIETRGPRNIQVERLDRAIADVTDPTIRGQLRRLRRLLVEPEGVKERGRVLPEETREATIDRLLEERGVRRELERFGVQGPQGAGPVGPSAPMTRRFQATEEPRAGGRYPKPPEPSEAELTTAPTSGLLAEDAPKALPATPEEVGFGRAILSRDGRVLPGEPGENWSQIAARNDVAPRDVARHGYVTPEAPEVLVGGEDAAQAVLEARRGQGAEIARDLDLPFRLAEEQRLEEGRRAGIPEADLLLEEQSRGARPPIPDPSFFLRPQGSKTWEDIQKLAQEETEALLDTIGKNTWDVRLVASRGRDEPVVRGELTVVAGGKIGSDSPQRNQLVDEMLRKGRVNAIGRRVTNELELATLGQMFNRNPYFEVFTYVATLGDVVLDTRAVTSRMPFETPGHAISAAEWKTIRKGTPEQAAALKEQKSSELEAWLKEVGADGFHMMHNHPSGYANPSSADINMTRMMAAAYPEGGKHPPLKSHVVLDHNHFATVDLGDQTPKLYPLPPEVSARGDLLSTPEVHHQMLGMKIAEDPATIAAVADQFGSSDRIVTLIHRDKRGYVVAVHQVSGEAISSGRINPRAEGDKIVAANTVAFYEGKNVGVIDALFGSAKEGRLDGLAVRFPDGDVQGMTIRNARALMRRGDTDSMMLREEQKRAEYKPEPVSEPIRYAAPLGAKVEVPVGEPYQGKHNSTWAAGAYAYRNQMIDLVGPELEAQRRSRIPLARQHQMARDLHLTQADFNALLGKQGLMLPAEYQARFVMEWENGVDRIVNLTGEIAAAKDPVKKRALEATLESIADATTKLWIAVQSSASEAGRTLGARKGKGSAYAKATKAILDETRLPPEVAQRMVRELVTSGGDRRKIRSILSEAYIPDVWDKILEARTMFLLSNPVTLMRNAVGNTLATISRLSETGAGVAGDALFSTLTGKPRERHFIEFTSDALGVWKGAQEGSRMFLRAMKDESYAIARGRISEAIPKAAIKPDLPGQGLSRLGETINQAQGPVGRALRMPGRALAATDILFTAANRFGDAYKRSAREVMKAQRELKGVDRADAIEKLAREALNVEETRMLEIAGRLEEAQTTAERIAVGAEQAGREYSFRKELGTWWKRADALRFATYVDPDTGLTRKTPGSIIARVFVPFLPTPINIMSFSFERTPLVGLAAKQNRAFFKLLGPNAKDLPREVLVDVWARQAVGMMLFAPLVLYAMEGKITGAPDKDPSVRSMLKPFRRESSLFVGGKWWSYRGFSPLTEVLATAAGIADAAYTRGEVPTTEKAMRIGMGMAATFLDQPFLTGLSDVMDALTDPAAGEQRMTSIAGNLASSFVIPRGVAMAARATDPTERDYPETIGEKLKQDTPGLRQTTTPYRDALGRKYEETSMVDNFAKAIVPTTDPSKASPVDKLLWLASGMPYDTVINYPQRVQLGRRTSPEVYDRLLEEKANTLVPLLERFAASGQGERIARNPEGRQVLRDIIQRFETQATEVARMKVIPAFELQELGLEPTRMNVARMTLMLSSPALRGVRAQYEDPANTNADRISILVTGRLAGGEVRQPVEPGLIRNERPGLLP